jgi:hypothetical protein
MHDAFCSVQWFVLYIHGVVGTCGVAEQGPYTLVALLYLIKSLRSSVVAVVCTPDVSHTDHANEPICYTVISNLQLYVVSQR